MVTIQYPHIELRSDGIPWIQGHETKVLEIVLDRIAYGSNVDDIHRHHPHLSLAEIHSALAYYYDNKDEVDADIDRRMQHMDDLFSRHGPSPAQQRLANLKAERLALEC